MEPACGNPGISSTMKHKTTLRHEYGRISSVGVTKYLMRLQV